MRIEFGDLKLDERVEKNFQDVLRTSIVSTGVKIKEFEEKWDIIPPTKEGAVAFISQSLDQAFERGFNSAKELYKEDIAKSLKFDQLRQETRVETIKEVVEKINHLKIPILASVPDECLHEIDFNQATTFGRDNCKKCGEWVHINTRAKWNNQALDDLKSELTKGAE